MRANLPVYIAVYSDGETTKVLLADEDVNLPMTLAGFPFSHSIDSWGAFPHPQRRRPEDVLTEFDEADKAYLTYVSEGWTGITPEFLTK